MYEVTVWTLDKGQQLGVSLMTTEEFQEWAKPRCHPDPTYLQTFGEFVSDGKTITFEQKGDDYGDGENAGGSTS